MIPALQGMHLGAKKTLEKVRSRFYWPGQKEVDKWCADCLVCNSRKSPVKNRAHLQLSFAAERPLQRIAMDIIGPLPVTPRDTIHTDQGRNFESGLIRDICQLLGVKKTRTTPYQMAWWNVLIERCSAWLFQITNGIGIYSFQCCC